MCTQNLDLDISEAINQSHSFLLIFFSFFFNSLKLLLILFSFFLADSGVTYDLPSSISDGDLDGNFILLPKLDEEDRPHPKRDREHSTQEVKMYGSLNNIIVQ